MSDGEFLPIELVRRMAFLGYMEMVISYYVYFFNVDKLIRAQVAAKMSAVPLGRTSNIGLEIMGMCHRTRLTSWHAM
ncbi:MAG: hypothetical protein LBU24_03470 [Methanocalculaceae archaeon]|jgi:hypothetical protein|nr:hypothetical protein [Methanocalculaceae archaeon]